MRKPFSISIWGVAIAALSTIVVILPLIYTYAPNFVPLMYLVLTGLAMLLALGDSGPSFHEATSPKELSLEACIKAFKKLQQWSSGNVIDAENFGYHKQLVEEFERVLERHLESYPKDGTRSQFKWYRDYINRSYDFTIKKW